MSKPLDVFSGKTPLRIVNSVAPIRICDNGGWTDTWFAGHGEIFNIGVYPYAEVQIEVYRLRRRRGPHRSSTPRTTASATRVGPRSHGMGPASPARGRHRVHARARRTSPSQVTIYSEAPAGASTGTSAAVTVALIGALDRLTPGPHDAPRGGLHGPARSRPKCSSSSAASRTSSARPTAASTTSRCSSIPTPPSRRSRCPTPSGGSWSGGWSLIYLGQVAQLLARCTRR